MQWKSALRIKFIVSLIFVSAFSLLITFSIMNHQAQNEFYETLKSKKANLIKLSEVLSYPLWNFDFDRVDKISNFIMFDEDIQKIAIYNEVGGVILNKSRKSDFEISEKLEIPLIYKDKNIDEVVGKAIIIFSKKQIESNIDSNLFSILFSFLIIILLTSLSIWLLFRKLIETPIKSLTTAIELTEEKQKFIKADYDSNDEFGVILSAFNRMQTSLENQHRNIESAQKKITKIYNSTPALAFTLNEDAVIISSSDYFIEYLKLGNQEIIGKSIYSIIKSVDSNLNIRLIEKAIQQRKEIKNIDLKIQNGNQESIDVILNAVPTYDESQSAFLAIFTDVTSLNKANRKLEKIANTDYLLGISNRNYFQSYLKRITEERSETKQPFALLYIDLDNFKHVNDIYGHHIGDKLLKLVAERILSLVSPEDIFARLGGDEFAIILHQLESSDKATLKARKLVKEISKRFILEESDIYISASIGISIYPHDSYSPDTLLRYADIAMYQAKESQNSQTTFYLEEHSDTVKRRVYVENILHKAIDDELLDIHYQPIICMEDRKIIGAEALLRLQAPSGETISPAEFIPIAEQSGLIVSIGEWCIEQSCAQLAAWHQSLSEELYISINVSTRQFQSNTFSRSLSNAIQQNNIPANKILLEITESLLLNDSSNNIQLISMLKGLGCRIAIDDFGTGFSSLSYLTSFDLDTIKIDQSFISKGNQKNLDNGLVNAIYEIAKTLNFSVIAEGVEEQQQLDSLGRISSKIAIQGYFFSRPLTAPDFEDNYEHIIARAIKDGT